MKILAPKYYNEFCCIADRCRHSCCIGWEIDVDSETLEKYDKISHSYGDVIRESIDCSDIPHFKLSENDRCPHLDSQGLCRIITNLGESCLCHICREHPRFYNDTPRGREAGLGISCEEACRIILSSDDYRKTVVIGEATDEPLPEFDSLPMRERIYEILADRTVPYPDRLNTIYCETGVSPKALSDLQWRVLLSELEYLDEHHAELFSKYTSATDTEEMLWEHLERFLAYLIYRHTGAARDVNDLRASIGFAFFCERLLASVAKDAEDLCDAARIISEELEYSEDNTEAIKMEYWF